MDMDAEYLKTFAEVAELTEKFKERLEDLF